MINLKNQKFNLISFVEILFYTFPLSFIVGNFMLSVHLMIFIIFSLLLIKKEKMPFKANLAHWLIMFFFLYIFLSTTIQFQIPGFLNEKTKDWPLESHPIFKSLILTRYLILIFLVNILYENKIIKLEKLFLFSLICTSFVSVDVIFQYFNGVDFFGYKNAIDRNSGPFGEELIAGSYLLKFSFFSFFALLTIRKNKKYVNYIFIIIIAFHSLAITLSGNRMPLILFLFGCFLIFIFVKNFRFIMSLGMITFLVMFIGLINYDKNFGHTYSSFFSEINIFKHIKNEKNKIEKSTLESQENENEPVLQGRRSQKNILLRGSGHRSIFETSIWVWKMRPLTGFGLKSFRIKCWDVLTMIKNNIFGKEANMNCATHSHNYYLEILVEAGIIGFIILISFFIIILKNSYLYFKKYQVNKNKEVYLLFPIIIIFIIEIWPLKSSGSFFTTWNATFIWLYLPLLINFKKSV